MPLLELPGLVDAHVHLRDPGQTHKEDWYSGTCAALHGGVVAVLDMPNNTPPTIDAASLAEKQAQAQSRAVCDYGLFVGASADNSATVAGLPAVGLKVYLNDTFGPLRLESLALLVQQFRSWTSPRPIAVHAEEHMVAVVLALSRLYDKHVHICHVSRRVEIELIRRAKEKGTRVTCEVTPHHLFLTDADAHRLGSRGHMKPTLGTSDDCNALWENLDIVDMVATDHAPHTIAEKQGTQAPAGVPGIESMLPLLLTAVAEGRLTMERLIALTSSGPACVYGIELHPGSRTVVDTDATYELSDSHMMTKCGWTPFAGRRLVGRIVRTFVRGTLAFDEGRILVPPGFGRPITPA